MRDSLDATASDDELHELVAATRGLQPWRRVFHAVNGVILGLGPILAGLSRTQTIQLVGLALVAQVILDIVRFRIPAVQRLFFRLARTLASPREAAGIASSTWYTLGALLAFILFPMGIASAAILVLGFADPAAGTIGRLFGTRKIGTGSLEGSLAFFATALLILLMAVDWPVAFAAAAVATAVEVMPGLGDDNLTIPMVTGGVLWLMLSGVG